MFSKAFALQVLLEQGSHGELHIMGSRLDKSHCELSLAQIIS